MAGPFRSHSVLDDRPQSLYPYQAPLTQPNFISPRPGGDVLFSQDPFSEYSEDALAIVSVPGGCTAPPTPTPTVTLTPTVTPPELCIADCNGDGKVTVAEIVQAVAIAQRHRWMRAAPPMPTAMGG